MLQGARDENPARSGKRGRNGRKGRLILLEINMKTNLPPTFLACHVSILAMPREFYIHMQACIESLIPVVKYSILTTLTYIPNSLLRTYAKTTLTSHITYRGNNYESQGRENSDTSQTIGCKNPVCSFFSTSTPFLNILNA